MEEKTIYLEDLETFYSLIDNSFSPIQKKHICYAISDINLIFCKQHSEIFIF